MQGSAYWITKWLASMPVFCRKLNTESAVVLTILSLNRNALG